jgi:hypothetical protein
MSDSFKKPGGSYKSIQTLMQKNSRLGLLVAHARVLNRLDQILTSVLDPNLSCHCQVAEFKNRSLILACSNATFATRIRMISPQLLDSFREEGDVGIERIDIRIAPVNRPQPEVRKKRTLSPAAIKALGRFASDSGDAEIQAIFDKINARRNG